MKKGFEMAGPVKIVSKEIESGYPFENLVVDH